MSAWHQPRRIAVAAGALTAAIACTTGASWWLIEGDGNVHWVQPGVVVRSAQPSAARLDDIVRQYHIRSVVNLRGSNRGQAWYDDELAASRANGLAHFDIPLSARRELSPDQIDAVLQVVAAAPKPVLIHCKAGSDRTGLVAASWQLAQGVPAQRAADQLSIRYGHFPWLGSRTVAMDRSFTKLAGRGGFAASSPGPAGVAPGP